MAPAANDPTAPPPAGAATIPTALLGNLRQPDKPHFHLVFEPHGTEARADLDIASILQAFAEALAQTIQERYDLQLTVPPPGASVAFVRILQLDPGSKLAGGTLEIAGHIASAEGLAQPFKFKHRGRLGMLGGSGVGQLTAGGESLGKKVGECVLNA